jgi:hypothetical protein
MVCTALPDDGTIDDCPDYTSVDPDGALTSAWGPCPEDDFCDYSATLTCGPELARTDACCYIMTDLEMICWSPGRPFMVNGQPQQVDCVSDNGWTTEASFDTGRLNREQRRRLGAHWKRMALAEHASVAAFARFTMQLMSIGAPADLVAQATRAQGDEIRHALDCLTVASELSDETLGLGGLNIEGALTNATDVNNILIDTIREACVNETVSAAQCQAAADEAQEPTIKAMLTQIAIDEQRHATLAWRTVRWILTEHPDLRDLAARTFEDAIAHPFVTSDDPGTDLGAFGALSASQDQEVAASVIRQVIRPCMDALFGETPDTRPVA